MFTAPRQQNNETENNSYIWGETERWEGGGVYEYCEDAF